MELKENIISFFLNHRKDFSSSKPYIEKQRDQAIDLFEKKGFPTLKQEEWKYTNLLPLIKRSYDLEVKKAPSITYEHIRPYLIEGLDAYRLVFINGIYNKGLSDKKEVKEHVCSLLEAFSIKEYDELIKKYYGHIQDKQESLSILNNAFCRDGAFIYISKGKKIEKPIELLYFYTKGEENPYFLHPRNLILIEKQAEVKLIERHISLEKEPFWANTLTEIYMGEASGLDYYKLQLEEKASLIDHTFIAQERDSHAICNTFSIEGEFIRNNLNFYQKNQGVTTSLNGLSLLDKEQLVDHHTFVGHHFAHSQSYQLYKGIFGGYSKGVFNGKIQVKKEAQKTNAFQQSNAIILSKEAIVNAKPQLEIFADDVKCSHGSTVGQLNPMALFYLRSRGIKEKEAKTLLIFAFLKELLDKLSIPSLKLYIEKVLIKKLDTQIEANE